MSFFPASLENLIDKFASLPGIGRKSAQRLAFHVLSLPESEANAFAAAIMDAKKSVHCCRICQNLTEGDICSDDIRIKELLQRVADEEVEEVIMATNPDTEGEATAMYISRLLKPFSIKVTRLAYGIPVGSNLEFADDATLNRAIEGRTEM